MLRKLLRPTNRRIRVVVGLLLAGLFCIQCTQTGAVRSSKFVTTVNGRTVGSHDDALRKKIDRLAREDHIALLELCVDNYDRQYRDYTCTLVKQEVIRGTRKGEQWMAVKFMEKPFSVAMKWLPKTPEGHSLYVPVGDRVLYVEGKHNDQMLVRPSNGILRALVGTQKRPPDGKDAMKNTLRPVNLFGFNRSMKSLLNVYREAKKHGHLKQAFGGYKKVAGREAVVLVRYLPPENDYPAYRTEIFIDVQMLVPVAVFGYGWDGDREPITRYIYKDIRFNVGLTDEDFTPEANDMAEPR